MVDSALKNMTKNSRLKVGTFLVEFNTPGIGQILKARTTPSQRLQSIN